MFYYVVNTSNPKEWLWSQPLESIDAANQRLTIERYCAQQNKWSPIDIRNCISVYQTMRDDMQGWQPRGVPTGKWLKG